MAGQFHNSTHRRSLGQRLALRLVATLLDFVWCAVLITVSPILIYRMLRYGKYRDGWREKFLGQLPVLAPATEGSQRYWFHAVSVGEVLLLRSLLPELRRRDPDAEIVLSTTTTTGRAVALAKFPDVTVCYFPLDLSRAVRRAIRNIQPTQIVLVELELWPNFLLAADSLGIPVSLINGRLSEKSFRGYSRIRPLMSRLLKTFRALGIQTSEYADRFEEVPGHIASRPFPEDHHVQKCESEAYVWAEDQPDGRDHGAPPSVSLAVDAPPVGVAPVSTMRA